jgi:hypothetical protein
MSKYNINNEIKKICISKNISGCEIRLKGCWGEYECHPAHRHKRRYYLNNNIKLSDYKQWIIACNYCHNKIEYDRKATEELFMRLRGPELTCPDDDDRLIYEKI